MHLHAALPRLVPVHQPVQRRLQVQPRMPRQLRPRAAGIELQIPRLMHAGVGIQHPARVAAPHPRHALRDPAHRLRVVFAWPKVKRRGKPRRLLRIAAHQLLCQQDVSMQRLQHMLPRTNRLRPANVHGLARQESAHQVRNQPVLRPVPAADDVPRARRRQRTAMLGLQGSREVALPVRRRHNLRAGLRAGVRIVAAQRIDLAIPPQPLLVLIALVGGHIQHRAHARRSPHRIQHARRSNHIGLIRPDRVIV